MSRRNPSSRSASSQKVEEKVCFSFSSCWTPRKGLSRPCQYFKAISMGIKCSNRKKLACKRPLVHHTAVSNITHSTIADQDSSHMYSMHVAHSTQHCWAAKGAVMRRWPALSALCICIILAERCQNVCASALLRLSTVHGSLHMNFKVDTYSVLRSLCRAPSECTMSACLLECAMSACPLECAMSACTSIQ